MTGATLQDERTIIGYTASVDLFTPVSNPSGGAATVQVFLYARMVNAEVCMPSSTAIVAPLGGQVEERSGLDESLVEQDPSRSYGGDQLPNQDDTQPNPTADEEIPDAVNVKKEPEAFATILGDKVLSATAYLKAGHIDLYLPASQVVNINATNSSIPMRTTIFFPWMWYDGSSGTTGLAIWNWVQSWFTLRRGSVSIRLLETTRSYLEGDPSSEARSYYTAAFLPYRDSGIVPSVTSTVTNASLGVTEAAAMENGYVMSNPTFTREIGAIMPYNFATNWVYYPPVGGSTVANAHAYPKVLPYMEYIKSEVFYGVDNSGGVHKHVPSQYIIVLNAMDDYCVSGLRPLIGATMTSTNMTATVSTANANVLRNT